MVTDDLLNETFKIHQTQDNLLKDIEPLVNKSKLYELSHVLSSISDSPRCIMLIMLTSE